MEVFIMNGSFNKLTNKFWEKYVRDTLKGESNHLEFDQKPESMLARCWNKNRVIN
jgi:hypothetical protein